METSFSPTKLLESEGGESSEGFENIIYEHFIGDYMSKSKKMSYSSTVLLFALAIAAAATLVTINN